MHINDTHPAVAPAEFMRTLVDDYGLEWDCVWKQAWQTRAIRIILILSGSIGEVGIRACSMFCPRVYQIIVEIG